MAKDTETADLFEADGVTPVKAAEKPVITAAQLDAETRAARAEGKADALEKVVAAKPEKALPAEKVFTRQELRAMVNDGKITEDQMDVQMDLQNEAKISRLVDEKVSTKVGAATATTTVSGKIAAYVEAFPAINDAKSPLRARIQTEFDELVALGDPVDSIATELKAIKIACGPLKPGAGRRPGPESHEEIGSGGEGGEKPSDTGWAKGLSAKQKTHYEKMIASGRYKGTSDPRLVAEVKFARRTH